MKNIIFLAAILFSVHINAQFVFEENIIIDKSNGTNGATDVLAVDLDSDGDLDILSSSSLDDKIAWYENIDGMGTFGTQQIISDIVEGAISVDAADLDGDGDLDVLCASSIDDYVAWFENLGNSTFGTWNFITCGSSTCNAPADVDAVDLDGDGDNDVLMTYNGDRQAWFENLDGQGSFSEKVNFGADNFDSKTTISGFDLDMDGDVDVLISAYDGIIWFENLDGQGDFPSEPDYISLEVNSGKSADAVDLDSDGDLDVLSASAGDNKIAWYENFNGLFGPQQIINSAAMGATSVSHADIDNDGDFISASWGDHLIIWYENLDGMGNFGSPQIISSEIQGDCVAYAGDLDGDNDIDVVSASFEDDKIAWYENTTGLGDFGAQINVSAHEGIDFPRSVYYADLDQDGDLDVLSASEGDDKIAWFENLDGQGNFSLQHIITTEASGANSVFASDLDGDGDQDVLSGAANSNEIAWYENLDGNGNFGSAIPVATAGWLDYVSTSDFDGDGDQDILVSTLDFQPSFIAWIENIDGQGNFDLPNILPNSDHEQSAISVDFDADGDNDIISVYVDGAFAYVKIHQNSDGLGNFVEFATLTAIVYARSIFPSDLDGDGDLDLLLNSGGQPLRWYVNLDGLGTYSQYQLLPNGSNGGISCTYQNVRTMDVDGDGDQDIVSSCYDSIIWRENLDGLGNFGDNLLISSNINQVSSLELADINGDGVRNILIAVNMEDRLSWFHNAGPLWVQENNNINLILYPNPASNSVKIKSEVIITSVQLFNQFGQLVYTKDQESGIDEISVDKLAPGVYFAKIMDDASVKTTKKLIVK